jgi:hypothetical protein
MHVHGTHHPTHQRTRTRLLGRAIPIAMAAGIAATAAITLPGPVTANQAGGRPCSNRSLWGDYGHVVSGVRGIGPGLTESFVATGLRTYDGNGQFTGVDNAHGQVTGVQRDAPVFGTYQVNADCSGTSMIFFPGVPFPVETAFVIVGGGDEVKDAVMAPLPNMVTAVARRVGR